MNKTIVLLAILLTTVIGYGQKERDIKLNKETSLIEATYYHDNGKISQIGTFNLEGALHGEWTSYDNEGNKIAVGQYIKGVKSGKWTFWNNGTKKEVQYDNNVIASVDGVKSTSKLTKNH